MFGKEYQQDSSLEEILEYIQKLQLRVRKINPAPLTRLERQCARDALFSSTLALQLFIIP